MENFHEINVENLLYKIEKFYKRFYINRLLKGIIFFSAIILSIFLLFDFIFYYSDLSDFVRFVIFYIFIFAILSGIYYWIIDPVLRLFKINSGLSLEDASEYIGNFYDDIGDRLLNTVQFYNSNERDLLVVAAMNQKAGLLSEYDFTKAVPTIRSNKYVMYALIPITFFIGIFAFNSEIITEGTNRLINYEVDYASIAPFNMDVINGNVKVVKGDDVEILVKLSGNDLPFQLNIVVDDAIFRMYKVKEGVFGYKIKNVYSDMEYAINAGKYSSKSYDISVIEDVVVSEVVALVSFPKYVHKPDMEIINPNLLNIPYGSNINWRVKLNNKANTVLVWNDSSIILDVDSDGGSSFMNLIYEDVKYELKVENELGLKKSGFIGEINVIGDKYPIITVSNDGISDSGKLLYLGKVQDDYGFTSLKAKFMSNDSVWFESLGFDDTGINDVFTFMIDPNDYNESLEICFVVSDNDALNGYKKSESDKFYVDVLSKDELDSKLEEDRNYLIKELNNLTKDTKELDTQFDELRKDLLDKKKLDWESENKLNKVLEKSKSKEERIEELNEKLKKYQEEVNKSNSQLDEELLEKQKELNELFERLMDDESKKLLKEFQELLDKMDKKSIQEHLEKMEMNNEDLKEELDLNLEIFKQMEFEREFNEMMDELEQLAADQEKLADETLDNEDSEDLLKKQDSLSERFDNLKEDMEKLDSLNSELSDPNDMKLDSADLEDISNEQEQAEDNLNKKDFKKSSDSQKKASDKMRKMKKSMEQSLDMNSSEQEAEDLEALRKILENLLVLSFEQEDLMTELKSIDRNDPRVVEINQDQKNMIESSDMVKDSLRALATRVIQLNEIIQNEVGVITKEMNNSVSELQERRFSETLMHQQKSLTGINNLAVLLDEIIQQMQEQQNQQKESNGSCSKPGQGKPKPSMKSSKMKQKDLAKKIEQLKKELEKGNKPGKMNPGKMGNGLSKEIAKMAAQQEMIRKEVQKMADELKKEGSLGQSSELKKLEEMLEKNEEDLINFELDNDFFMRQKDIEIRMLEAENAKRERDLDNKRESNEAVDVYRKEELDFELYKKEKEFELELLRIFNPALSDYYKSKVQNYNLNSK